MEEIRARNHANRRFQEIRLLASGKLGAVIETAHFGHPNFEMHCMFQRNKNESPPPLAHGRQERVFNVRKIDRSRRCVVRSRVTHLGMLQYVTYDENRAPGRIRHHMSRRF